MIAGFNNRVARIDLSTGPSPMSLSTTRMCANTSAPVAWASSTCLTTGRRSRPFRPTTSCA